MKAAGPVRQAVARVAAVTGATANGVGGQAAAAYDINNASNTDLAHVVPVVLIAIAILLAVVLRSLVAPLYLMVSVGLSYLAALGLAVVVFMGIGGGNLLVPSTVVLLGRWNWWPSHLVRQPEV